MTKAWHPLLTDMWDWVEEGEPADSYIQPHVQVCRWCQVAVLRSRWAREDEAAFLEQKVIPWDGVTNE